MFLSLLSLLLLLLLLLLLFDDLLLDDDELGFFADVVAFGNPARVQSPATS